MSIYQHLLFLACVALAYARTMTGFAFGLVLLGLSGVFQLASVSEVANVVSVLSLVNAAVTLAAPSRRSTGGCWRRRWAVSSAWSRACSRWPGSAVR